MTLKTDLVGNGRKAKQTTPRTLVQFAAEQLRKQIFLGEISADKPIRITKLAEDLGVSPIPIREALQLLSAEGLVVAVPRRGYTVAKLTIEDLDDTYRLRIMMEPLAMELAVPNLDNDDLATIQQELRLVEEGGLEARNHHREAHFNLYNKCNSVWLMRCIEMLWQNAQRYQILTERIEVEFARRLEEHWLILKAAESGDAGLASKLVAEHLERAAAVIRGYLAGLTAGLPNPEEVATAEADIV